MNPKLAMVPANLSRQQLVDAYFLPVGLRFLPVADIHKMPGDGGGSGHRRADEVGAPAASLAALEVAVAGGGAAFAFGELVAVHGDAHTATRLTPLETGVAEDVGQSFLLGHAANLSRAGYD